MRRVRCYEMVYVAHLRAFGAPCAIVEAKEQLKKHGDHAMMCFFIGKQV